MPWCVYILYSKEHQKSYVGCTGDLAERLKTHNKGKVASTKRYIPWEMVHIEELNSYAEARKREKYYKSGAGRKKMKVIFVELNIDNR